jgi:multiple sugar transport system substrate-binding protein
MKIRTLQAGAAALVFALCLAGCASSNSGSSSSTASTSNKGVVLKYWATNQGSSLDNDKQILQPELDKFKKQTGITVDLEVVPWSDMTNNTLAAAVSGQGPDVVNIGNTNATTFQSTGAFEPFDKKALDEIGGKSKFVESAFATAGPAGKDVTSLPLYGQVYGLFYNKKLFSDAGLTPPKTWEDLISDAKTLTKPSEGQWGMVMPAGTVNVSMHMSFIFTEQHGASPFDKAGNPKFTSAAMVAGVKQYIDLMSTDKVLNPSDAQYADGTQASADFANGKVGMYFAQTANGNVLQQDGMSPDKYGVVPIPTISGGDNVGSFVAGTNISIFKSTKHLDASLQFVKFMTSKTEQEILNKKYTSLPVVKGVPASAFASTPAVLKTWGDILANNSKPLPLVPTVAAFQTNVGGAVVALMAQAATGQSVSESDIKAALTAAQQKMGATG